MHHLLRHLLSAAWPQRSDQPCRSTEFQRDKNGAKISTDSSRVLRVGQLRFAWSPPEWVVATSLCQSAGRYPPPHGILKENLLWARTFDTLKEPGAALVEFSRHYNETWLVARHGYRTPAQVRAAQSQLDQNAMADLKLAA